MCNFFLKTFIFTYTANYHYVDFIYNRAIMTNRFSIWMWGSHRVCVFIVLIELHVCPHAVIQDLALIVLATHKESGSATPALTRAVGLWHHSPPQQPSASHRAIAHQHSTGACCRWDSTRPEETDRSTLPGLDSRTPRWRDGEKSEIEGAKVLWKPTCWSVFYYDTEFLISLLDDSPLLH